MNETNLIFKRQFIICAQPISTPKQWRKNSLKGSKFNVYSHPDLRHTEGSNDLFQVIILGICKDNFLFLKEESVIAALIQSTNKEEYLDSLSGKFIIIINDITKSETSIYQDATGMKEVFYSNFNNEIIVGSQPTIINHYFNLVPSENPEIQDFLKSTTFLNKNIFPGNLTHFKNTLRLKPNFKLNLKTKKSTRYWPQKKIQQVKLNNAVKEISTYLKNTIENIVENENKVSMAVTAGYDSRLLLAASKEKSNRIKYFIFKHNTMKENNMDLTIPKNIFSEIGLQFNIIDYETMDNENIKSIYNKNLYSPSKQLFNTGYSGFNEHLSSYITLSSVSEVVRNYYHFDTTPESCNGKIFSILAGYKKEKLAQLTYQQWIDTNRTLFKDFNINILDMFYWEETMANSIGNNRSCFDCFIEEYSPFNCRKIIELCMGVNPKLRGRYNNVLFNKVIKNLWPEISTENINPSFKNSIIRILMKLNLYRMYKTIINFK